MKNVVSILKNWYTNFDFKKTVGPQSPRRAWEFDYLLLLTLLFLLIFGLIMVYSASFIYAQEKTGDGFSFIRKQCLYGLLGLGILWRVSWIPVQVWEKWATALLVISLILVSLTFVPGIGMKAGGARRWVRFLGLHGQPAELAKFAILFFVSKLLCHPLPFSKPQRKYWLALLPMAILLLLQPDFGTVGVLCGVMGLLIFLTGLSWKWIFSGLGIGGSLLFLVLISSAYRRHRLLAFLDPWQDPGGKGFQVIQSFIGLHHGRFFGVGLGNGKEKLFYLPEAHNDFIFSVIGEELGFMGTGVLACVFLFFIYRGLKIASDVYLRTRHLFSFFLAVSITLALGLQALMNMSVVLGLVPTKGLTLPFVSYGGSALLVDLFAMGVLFSISRMAQATPSTYFHEIPIE